MKNVNVNQVPVPKQICAMNFNVTTIELSAVLNLEDCRVKLRFFLLIRVISFALD